jgi:hypothetical protein
LAPQDQRTRNEYRADRVDVPERIQRDPAVQFRRADRRKPGDIAVRALRAM